MPEPIVERVDIIIRTTMNTGEVYEEIITQRPNLSASGPSVVMKYLNSFVDAASRAMRATKLANLTKKVTTT